MKFLLYTSAYPAYIENFYSKNPEVKNLSYEDQRKKFFYDSFSTTDAWSTALKKFGYDGTEIYTNNEFMQRAWAKENLPQSKQNLSLDEIAFEQVKTIRPEILWFDSFNAPILKKIRSELSSIRLVLGEVGSAMMYREVFRDVDFVLSCAPESVQTIRGMGFKSEHLNHAFDERILSRIQASNQDIDLSFIGQIILGSGFHEEREARLIALCENTNIQIFSPSASLTNKDKIKSAVKKLLNNLKIKHYQNLHSVHAQIKPHLQPAVFGLDMYRVIHNSKVVLNIHADSSPTYASNMRLFEITGMGSCMLTDWKKNIHELFEPENEIVTYQSTAECIEKAKWLLENPQKRKEISEAGQKRTLKEHNFAKRAEDLNKIIKRYLE